MIDFYRHSIVDTGRLPLFGFFVAFMVTFVVTRVNVRLIRADVRWWFRNVKAGDLHIHHVVFGVVLMLVGGVSSIAVPDAYEGVNVVIAAVFGVGAALVLDEFALILHLRDVYWTEQGRASVDAVFVATAITGLLLLGERPFGFEGIQPDSHGGLVLLLIYYGTVLANLVLAVVTLLKGKIWTGLAGLFVPAVLVIGAIRIARPVSPWARWRYAPDSRKHRRAVRHEERVRRPIIRAKIWVQEFIAGRHDRIIPPELRHRRLVRDRPRRGTRTVRDRRYARGLHRRRATHPRNRRSGTD